MASLAATSNGGFSYDSDSDSSCDLFGLNGVTTLSMDTASFPDSFLPFIKEIHGLEDAILSSKPIGHMPDDALLTPMCYEMCDKFQKGEYLALLESSPLFQSESSSSPKFFDGSALTNTCAFLTSKSASATDSSAAEAHFVVFLTALSCYSIYLQSNYTGPQLADTDVTTTLTAINLPPNLLDTTLNLLSVDGDLPTPVVSHPIFLHLTRELLPSLAQTTPNLLKTLSTWSLRATHAHVRLLQFDSKTAVPPFSATLFTEALTHMDAMLLGRWGVLSVDEERGAGTEKALLTAAKKHAASTSATTTAAAVDVHKAVVCLEIGLTCVTFEAMKMGKPFFKCAMAFSGVTWEITGAVGKKTKFQQNALAQMVCVAASHEECVRQLRLTEPEPTQGMAVASDHVPTEEEHGEDSVLLKEGVKYDDDKLNNQSPLTKLDQSILLALCLDVKNANPMDGLTHEEMMPFLQRVLISHDDWMIYSTALLERAWLESHMNHARERAIIQIQALVDQHTNRLTITQSTVKAAVTDSAPAHIRLRNVHSIVYPPRWGIKQDLAERYASLGVVSTAAEIFEELHLWDEVVECYQHAKMMGKAEEVIRRELKVKETPRMWASLGDITSDAECYEKSWALSGGKYARAKAALGKLSFDKGDLRGCYEHMEEALRIKPLVPSAWFLLGTTSMRLGEWDTAREAFSQVVQQVPEEGDAWANLAAIHIHNKNPEQAFPALNESLKHARSNWRVWINKMFCCMDLKKFDDAIQCCHELMDLKKSGAGGKDFENMEVVSEKVIRGLVGGCLGDLKEAQDRGELTASDKATLDSKRRSAGRMGELLKRVTQIVKGEVWVWEVSLRFGQVVSKGLDFEVDCLVKALRIALNMKKWDGAGSGRGVGEGEGAKTKDAQVEDKVLELTEMLVAKYKKLGEENDGARKVECDTKVRYCLKDVNDKFAKDYEFRNNQWQERLKLINELL